MLNAHWIWLPQENDQPYNQTMVARKHVELPEVQTATLTITADSAYRLFINGAWVADGPARAWPEHYQYDRLDVTPYVHPGSNEIRVIAKYWGTGTFHQVPRRPGLLAQLDVALKDGETAGDSITAGTDGTWEVAAAPAWIQNTPKVSIQMEPQELYDARREENLAWQPADVLCAAGEGPWTDLHLRDVAMLTRTPMAFKAFRGAGVVRHRPDIYLCLPAARLAHPDLIEANHNTMQAGGIATRLTLDVPAAVQFVTEGLQVYVDGRPATGEPVSLAAGDHIVLAFVDEPLGHRKEKTLRIVDPPTALELVNPLAASEAPDTTAPGAIDNPWCWIAFPAHKVATSDLQWPQLGHEEEIQTQLDAYLQEIETLGETVDTVAAFREHLADRVSCMPTEQMFVVDTHWRFLTREPIADAHDLVEDPAGLIYDNAEVTVVHPSAEGDVELIYDLGEQAIGYYDFELIADAGVQIDIYGVEYIAPDGRIQHTGGNRNGLRYITHAGVNRFTSTKRRSGRYLFITLRHQTSPVRIRKLQLITSTYPVNAVGDFRCSDQQLTQIWAIAARTLKLCMEDTFTDCPLYEQTLWVGDARNESAFAYPVFDATDIGRRCIRLAGQSLERYPIVGCQVPSSWDVLLPAWSFLWGISVWDYYMYTGDAAFVREAWPWVIQNLEGAAALRDPETGLFSGPFWNMFDWTGIDDEHETVLHNSMLMAGAVDAAQKAAEVLGETTSLAWLKTLRDELASSLNALWDEKKQAYPDSVHEDGTVSESTSQHTSFLALLYDIIPEANTAAALQNTLNPPEEMIRVGSPFAIMYYYEALEKVGALDAIVDSIYEAYVPMLEAGATTVWEVFPTSGDRPGGFPTRSHVHAWSSAPVYFLNRIVLGIRPTAPGGAAYDISPRLEDLAWAEGTVATAKGPLHVAWQADDTTLRVQVKAPEGVALRFLENKSHADRQVIFEVAQA